MMNWIRRHDVMATLLVLALLEVLTFGAVVSRIGFYLDDWNMLRQLHFGPQDFSMLQHYFLNDPKLIPRPINALHFMLMFVCFGLKPIGYHILNGIMEVATALFAYLVTKRLSESRLLAVGTAIFFLLNPIHDSTHYWVVASSATLSMMLYMASLFAHIEAKRLARPLLLVGAYLMFAISIFNYECFLPLFPLNLLAAQYEVKKFGLKPLALEALPYIGAIGLVVAYGKFIVPLLGTAWLHAAVIDPAAIISTVAQGVNVSLSPASAGFFFNRFRLDDAVSQIKAWLALSAAIAVTAPLLFAFKTEKVAPRKLAEMAAFGLAVIVLSYTIYGLNSEYFPTLTTIVNRINYASAFGVALILASIVALIANSPKPSRQASGALASVIVIAFCMFSDWAMARPWEQSWMMQRHVRSVLTANRTEIRPQDSIILVNAPRYVMWAPLFDGAWDFQNLAQITLNDDTISGGVASERLKLDRAGVTDVSHDFVCGKYPFDRMHALVATKSELLKVHGPEEFIEIIKERGLGFDLDKTLPAKWREQLQVADSHRAISLQ